MKFFLFDSKNYCTPARVYLVISFIYVVIHVLMMMGHDNDKIQEDEIPTFLTDIFGYNSFVYKILATLFEILCIFIWAWVLNSICNHFKTYGHTISWVLVIVPLVLQFITLIMGAIVVSTIIANIHSQNIPTGQIMY